jgi:hypothetical protein
MLALAKRSVVTEKVDTLLKVGLGPTGKVCITAFKGSLDLTVSPRATSRLLDIHALLSNDSTAVLKRSKVRDVSFTGQIGSHVRDIRLLVGHDPSNRNG